MLAARYVSGRRRQVASRRSRRTLGWEHRLVVRRDREEEIRPRPRRVDQRNPIRRIRADEHRGLACAQRGLYARRDRKVGRLRREVTPQDGPEYETEEEVFEWRRRARS